MRARNIKPAFFKNEQLADNDPKGRLLFIGLWLLADFKGCLEYRPRKIKIEILPYDNVDIEKLTNNLDKSGLIRLYSVQGKQYIKILNFLKHQNPHKNEREKGSDIPDIEKADSTNTVVECISEIVENNRDKNGTTHDKNEIDRADSLFLNPDSRNLNPDNVRSKESNTNQAEWLYNFYHSCLCINKNGRDQSIKNILKILKIESKENLILYIENYKNSSLFKKNYPDYVYKCSNFFGQKGYWKDFIEPEEYVFKQKEVKEMTRQERNDAMFAELGI